MLIFKNSVVPWPVGLLARRGEGPKGLGPWSKWSRGPYARWSVGPLDLGPWAWAVGLGPLDSAYCTCGPPNMLIIFHSIQVFGWRHRVQVAMPKLPCMSDFRVVKARSWIRRAFFGVHGGLRIQRRCQQPTLCWWL